MISPTSDRSATNRYRYEVEACDHLCRVSYILLSSNTDPFLTHSWKQPIGFEILLRSYPQARQKIIRSTHTLRLLAL